MVQIRTDMFPALFQARATTVIGFLPTVTAKRSINFPG